MERHDRREENPYQQPFEYAYLQIPVPEYLPYPQEQAQEEPTAPEERRVIIIDI